MEVVKGRLTLQDIFTEEEQERGWNVTLSFNSLEWLGLRSVELILIVHESESSATKTTSWRILKLIHFRVIMHVEF